MLSNNSGIVQELFISVKNKDRENKDEIILQTQGVCEDKFFDKEINRSVLLTSIDSYKLAEENNIDIKYGSLGENILMDINPYYLNIGDKILVADVILEITQNCTICNSLAKVDAKLPTLLKSDRGIFAKTLKGGVIKKGDVVKFVSKRKNNEENI